MVNQLLETTGNEQINSFGGGGHAPKGGKYVIDKKGDEIFYKGGQYLPEFYSNKLTKAKRKKIEKVVSEFNDIVSIYAGIWKMDKTFIIQAFNEQGFMKKSIKFNDENEFNYIIEFIKIVKPEISLTIQ